MLSHSVRTAVPKQGRCAISSMFQMRTAEAPARTGPKPRRRDWRTAEDSMRSSWGLTAKSRSEAGELHPRLCATPARSGRPTLAGPLVMTTATAYCVLNATFNPT